MLHRRTLLTLFLFWVAPFFSANHLPTRVFLGAQEPGEIQSEFAELRSDDNGKHLRLVPFPKRVQVAEGGFFDLSEPMTILLPKEKIDPLGEQIAEEFTRRNLPTPLFLAGDDPVFLQIVRQQKKSDNGNSGDTSRDDDNGCVARRAKEEVFAILPTANELTEAAKSPIDPNEGYAIRVDSNGIVAVGCGGSGLDFACQTIRQLIRANLVDGKLAAMTIRDWPSLRYRCFMDDFTRGPSPKRSEIVRFLEIGSQIKHNMFTYYMESQIALKKHPIIGPANGSIDTDDLRAMVQFGKERSLTILGTQQSFSHSGNILKHPEYAEMGEAGYILSPVVPRTYQFLDDLYSEICPVFPFEMFNVCCDETWDLGKGPSKALAEQIGVPGVYMLHIQRVHQLLKNHGKRMMMWGDIIMKHPERISEIPADMVMLCWDYAPRPNYHEFILPYSEAGFEFFVCPGISNWSRMLCDHQTAVVNIQNFVRDGVNLGALGMINTNWKDDGESLQGYTSYATAWGGEASWSGGETEIDDFNRRIGAVLFGEQGDHFGQAIREIVEVQKVGYIFNARFWQNDFAPTRSPQAIRTEAEKILQHIRPAIEHLLACQQEATVNADQLEAYLFGARRMELIATRLVDGVRAMRIYQKAYALNKEVRDTKSPSAKQSELLSEMLRLVQAQRVKHTLCGEEFARLWNRESKPYALDWTMNRYKNLDLRFAELEEKIQNQLILAKEGKPISPIEEVGMGLPEEFRKTTAFTFFNDPDNIADEITYETNGDGSLAPLRCQIQIDPKGKDRLTLPVELVLGDFLPEEYRNKPVRAFLVEDSASNQAGEKRLTEIPAQLDRFDDDQPVRLTFVLPSLTARFSDSVADTEEEEYSAKNVTVTVCVDFGSDVRCDADSEKSSAESLGGVKTSDGPNGMKWVENNRVKLLLGSAGGHIFRWGVKERGDREMTLEGESDYAGFADVGFANRNRPLDLVLLASGPAMVRYGFFFDGGIEKTITLYANSPVCEVRLVEPTTYYWDFDSPKNFSSDEGGGGVALFSDGKIDTVGAFALQTAEVQRVGNSVDWGIKYDESGLALGLVTPDGGSNFRIGPGGGMGGVGVETTIPRSQFITFCGVLSDSAETTMNGLKNSFHRNNQPLVRVGPLKKWKDLEKKR